MSRALATTLSFLTFVEKKPQKNQKNTEGPTKSIHEQLPEVLIKIKTQNI